MNKHNHYFFDVSKYEKVDIYRLIEIIGITCPVAQHVFKKAAAAGQRGHKDLQTDWQNIMDSAARKLEMIEEDAGQSAARDRKQPTILELCGVTDQARAAALAAAWSKGEKRMDVVGQNGPTAEHYWNINHGVAPDICPATRVIVEYRNGEHAEGYEGDFCWGLRESDYDIIRYRLIHE